MPHDTKDLVSLDDALAEIEKRRDEFAFDTGFVLRTYSDLMPDEIVGISITLVKKNATVPVTL